LLNIEYYNNSMNPAGSTLLNSRCLPAGQAGIALFSRSNSVEQSDEVQVCDATMLNSSTAAGLIKNRSTTEMVSHGRL
jgi:hypothetical protein